MSEIFKIQGSLIIGGVQQIIGGGTANLAGLDEREKLLLWNSFETLAKEIKRLLICEKQILG